MAEITHMVAHKYLEWACVPITSLNHWITAYSPSLWLYERCYKEITSYTDRILKECSCLFFIFTLSPLPGPSPPHTLVFSSLSNWDKPGPWTGLCLSIFHFHSIYDALAVLFSSWYLLKLSIYCNMLQTSLLFNESLKTWYRNVSSFLFAVLNLSWLLLAKLVNYSLWFKKSY